MKTEMHAQTSPDHTDKIAVFMQQMIPHHKNAINMAKLLLKQETPANIAAVEGMEHILYDIINVQSYQVHQFRNYLGPLGLLPPLPTPATTQAAAEDQSSSRSNGLLLSVLALAALRFP
jgi:hypothetical protein